MRINLRRAFFEIYPKTGYVLRIYISASNSQKTAVIMGTVARVTKHNAWGWIRRLIWQE